MWSDRRVFYKLLIFRVCSAILIQTSFVPDEYWQSTEVAHNLVFGYGYLTWEYKVGLRSYLYPLLFAGVFKVLSLLHLDHRMLLIFIPKVVQAIFGALGDFYTYRLAQKLCDQSVALWTLLSQVSSWFMFYTATRTMTNSMETALTAIGLYYFPVISNRIQKIIPWNSEKRLTCLYTCIGAFSVMIRPTSAIIWFPLCLLHLIRTQNFMKILFLIYLSLGSLIVSFSTAVDYFCYGRWIFVPFNFFKFNVLSDLSSVYGTHSWHWYFTVGLPVILGPHLPPFLIGIWLWKDKTLVYLLFWIVAVYSCFSHKEFRFILCVMPLAMCCCGVTFHWLCHQGTNKQLPLDTKFARWLLTFLLIMSFPLALYTSLVHQRGTLDVMNYLHSEASNNNNMQVQFLMPCHSTPFYSHLHQNISLRFLTCEPNLDNIPNYIDKADRFYQDPNHWLSKEYPITKPIPSHWVFFDSLYPAIQNFMKGHGLKKCLDLFHTHFPEGKVGRRIFVFCSTKK